MPDVPFAPTLTPRDVLSFATIDGARACGLDHRVGSLSPGKEADIVLIRTNALNVAPVIDPVASVVLYADTANVDSVFVRGRAVKRDGAMVGIDVRVCSPRASAPATTCSDAPACFRTGIPGTLRAPSNGAASAG